MCRHGNPPLHLLSRKGSLPSRVECASWHFYTIEMWPFLPSTRLLSKTGFISELLFYRCTSLFDGFSTQSRFRPLFCHRCNSPINIFQSLLHLSVCFPENPASHYEPRVYTLTISMSLRQVSLGCKIFTTLLGWLALVLSKVFPFLPSFYL